MEIIGTIKIKGELFESASGFQKKDMVVLTDEQYPQPLNIEFLAEKSDLPDFHEVGDKVKVLINLKGREWTSPQGEVKYFNQIVGWRIEKMQ